MSPRRRVLVTIVVALLLVAGAVVGVRFLPSAEPAVDPVARPAQHRPGPVLLVPGYGGSRGGLQRLAARIEATGRSATVLTLVGDGTVADRPVASIRAASRCRPPRDPP